MKGLVPASNRLEDKQNDMEEEQKNISSVYFSFEVCAAPLKKKNKNKKKSSLKQKPRVQRGVGTNNVNGEQKKRTTSVFDKSSCCHIPSPHQNTAKCLSS